jgi:hypothetical protein
MKPFPSKRSRGQVLYLFLGLLVALMLIYAAVKEFGRFMLLHGYTAAYADLAAVSAANALDLNASKFGDWQLNEGVARKLAEAKLVEFRKTRLQYEAWIMIRLESVTIAQNKVHVVAVGECPPIFLSAIGVNTFYVRVDSYARAAIGIENEISWLFKGLPYGQAG